MTDWQALLNPDIKAFIRDHENADIATLALKKPPKPDWPYADILDQIKSRQKARIKIPEWLDHDDIIFPAPGTLEQASSEATAKYKASLFQGKTFVDLTGGAGIDSWAMLEKFETATIIEKGKNAAQRFDHNIKILKSNSATVKNESAEVFIEEMPHVDLAIIDPQRRNTSRKGLYKLEDCEPNILGLLPKIKADTILLKTSPMLDIAKGIKQLGHVSAVHIVEWSGECKELLFILKPNETNENPPITAVTINNHGQTIHDFTFTTNEENEAELTLSPPQNYLYEPSPAFMKVGAHKLLAQKYGLSKLAADTQLLTSKDHVTDFPGRSFKIIETYPAKTKALPFKKANLSVRNFPQDVKALKNKLKLKDGGEDYIFACSVISVENPEKESYRLIHCKKL